MKRYALLYIVVGLVISFVVNYKKGYKDIYTRSAIFYSVSISWLLLIVPFLLTLKKKKSKGKNLPSFKKIVK